MAKRRVGLHKEITSIFDGVPIQKSGGVRQSPQAPAPNRTSGGGYHKKYSRTAVAAKPSATNPKTPVAPKHQHAAQSVSKAVPPEKPKTDTAAETTRQIRWQQTVKWIKSKLLTPKPGVSGGRQKMMAVLVPVLFVILIVVFIKVLSPPTRGTSRSVDPEPTGVVPAARAEVDWQVPEPYPATLRDPMQFGSVPTDPCETDTNKLVVKGIIFSEGNPSAIVGNKIVHKGDQVSGVTVVEIYKDSVEFESNGKRWTQKVK